MQFFPALVLSQAVKAQQEIIAPLFVGFRVPFLSVAMAAHPAAVSRVGNFVDVFYMWPLETSVHVFFVIAGVQGVR